MEDLFSQWVEPTLKSSLSFFGPAAGSEFIDQNGGVRSITMRSKTWSQAVRGLMSEIRRGPAFERVIENVLLSAIADVPYYFDEDEGEGVDVELPEEVQDDFAVLRSEVVKALRKGFKEIEKELTGRRDLKLLYDEVVSALKHLKIVKVKDDPLIFGFEE